MGMKLKAFEKLVFHQWPLNYGQVYTTLSGLNEITWYTMRKLNRKKNRIKSLSYHRSWKKSIERVALFSANHNIYFDMAFKVILFDIISTKMHWKSCNNIRIFICCYEKFDQLREEMKDAPLGKQFMVKETY